MQPIIYAVLAILFLVAPACAPTDATVLQHPQTLQTVECKRDPWKNWTWQDEEVRKKCAEKYKALGFVEVSGKKVKNATLSQKLADFR